MGVLGGWAFSFEQGTPVGFAPLEALVHASGGCTQERGGRLSLSSLGFFFFFATRFFFTLVTSWVIEEFMSLKYDSARSFWGLTTPLIRNRHPPQEHPMALGIGLL